MTAMITNLKGFLDTVPHDLVKSVNISSLNHLVSVDTECFMHPQSHQINWSFAAVRHSKENAL